MVSQATQKYVLTFFMFFNGFITPGGIIYGWPGFTQLLKDEYQFSDGCPDYDPKGKACPSQDNSMGDIFTVGANLATIATIVYGFTLDRYGVRVNALSGALLMCGGFILCAFSDTQGEHPFNAFMPGFAMIAFGGLGTYLPAFQFSSLFARPTRILSIQSALFTASGLMFTFFKFLSESYGISRKTSFIAYAMLVAFCGLNMVLLYPKKAYKPGDMIHLPVLGWLGIQQPPTQSLDALVNGESTGETISSGAYSPLQDEADDLVRSSSKLDVYDTSSPSGDASQTSEFEIELLKAERLVRDLTPDEFTRLKNSRTLREEILNPGTFLVALHFSVGLLCSNMYNANISTLLTNMGDQNSKYANIFVFVTSLYPILFSLTIDELQKKFRYAGTSFIATTGLIVSLGLLFVSNLNLQVFAFFIFATGRSLLITVMFSFVAVEYRGDHYGRVIAFVTSICAAIGFLQLAMQKIYSGPANNNFDYISAGMMIALAPLYYFTWWCHKNRV